MKTGVLSGAVALAVLLAMPASAQTGCAMSPDDRQWVEGALKASDHVMLQTLHLPADPRPTILVFDRNCSFESKPSDPGKWVDSSPGKNQVPGRQ